MKITCPYCNRPTRVSPEQLLGKYLICSHCHRPFRWQADGRNPEKKSHLWEEKGSPHFGAKSPTNGGKAPEDASDQDDITD